MLTICIPTVPQRRGLLSRLLFTLQPQVGEWVKVLIAGGDWPLGDKVNAMFAAADTASWVVVVDDDDLVAVDYANRVLPAMWRAAPNMVGYKLLWTEAGRYMGSPLHHGAGHPTHDIDDRGAALKVPIRAAIAKQHPMGNHYSADHDWAMAVHPEIGDEYVTLDRHLYHYDHWNDQMVGTDLGGEQAAWYSRPQRDVGEWPHDPSLFTWITQG
jgi:hypothetical protein